MQESLWIPTRSALFWLAFSVAKEQLHPWSVIPRLRKVLLEQLIPASNADMLEGMWGHRVLRGGISSGCFKSAVIES